MQAIKKPTIDCDKFMKAVVGNANTILEKNIEINSFSNKEYRTVFKKKIGRAHV